MSNKEINCGLSDIVSLSQAVSTSSLHQAMAINASLKALVMQFTL